jgi:hypothetical protein
MGDGGSLVGRQCELATLGTLLGAATGGRGRAAVALGEPGIGKTALAEVFATGALADAAGGGTGGAAASRGSGGRQ